MLNCETTRNYLATEPEIADPAVQEHLERCVMCARYHRQQISLDCALKQELHWEVPAALSARLLALAAPMSLATPAPPVGPKRWYVMLVSMLTLAAIVLSVLVGWQLVSLLIAQVGLQDALAQIGAAPARGLAQLTQALPESRYVIDFFLKVRDQLMWLLLVAVLWAALDGWSPQLRLQGRQAQS